MQRNFINIAILLQSYLLKAFYINTVSTWEKPSLQGWYLLNTIISEGVDIASQK